MSRAREPKACAACGRTITWRRKWARCWDQVRYCGERCRRRGARGSDAELERAIVALLAARKGTICPSEAARRVGGDDWRRWMEDARAAGRRLAARDALVVLQRGRPVDPSRARGPVRFGRGPDFAGRSVRR